MHNIGISTGCFYPEKPEDSIRRIHDLGIRRIELFINTGSETEMTYCKSLKDILDFYGISAVSLHPFTSFAESFLFFSAYDRRFADGLDIYDRYFEMCNLYGAKTVNFHGLKSEHFIEPEKYAEVYSRLYCRAKESGVVFSQENVRNHVCGKPEYCRRLKNILGDEISFTLDIKQAHREGFSPEAFAEIFADRLCLVHINDFDEKSDCLLPFAGIYDIEGLVSRLKNGGYNGNYIIEVYSGNYSDTDDIRRSFERLKTI